MPFAVRCETGVVVEEFRDLRANPRCMVESQLIGMRVRWGRAVATGLFAPDGVSQASNESTLSSRYPPGSLQLPPALPFDTISSYLPERILCSGAAVNFPTIANIVCDVFGRRVYVGMSQIDSAQITPHTNAPVRGFPGRAALGSALVARWVWGNQMQQNVTPVKQDSLPARGPFEAAIHATHARRWEENGGTWARTNVSTGAGTTTPTHVSYTPVTTPGLTTPGGTLTQYSRGSTPTLQAHSPQMGMFNLNSPQATSVPNSAVEGEAANVVPINALPVIYPSDRGSNEQGMQLNYGTGIQC